MTLATPSGGGDHRWSSARFAVGTAVAAWLIYLASAAIRCVIYGFPNPRWLIERHALTAGIAVGMALVVFQLLRQAAHRSTRQRLGLALAATLPAAALLSVFNYKVMYVFAPPAYVQALGLDLHPGLIGEVLHSSIENYFVFAGWAVLWTAVSQTVDTEELLRRGAVAETAARTAELRALRLQLDPHFLFNALNTVSGLVVSGRADEADRTIEALSAFLRASLEADASADLPLCDELHLQKLYLSIEAIRFGHRLRIVFDIDDSLTRWPVPALILQPLVENSIRHAVARTSRPVTVRVTGRRDAARLILCVEDDGPGETMSGGGVGLRNVAGRLDLRYGKDASMLHERRDGHTRTILTMPNQPEQTAA